MTEPVLIASQQVRKRRMAPWIAGGVALVLIAVVLVLATSKSADQRVDASPLIGRPAPVAAGEVVSGPSQELSDLHGKFVLVNFFATWCVPCRKEHPELVQFAKDHAQVGDAAVMQIVYGDQLSVVRPFLKKNGGDWTVLNDPTGSIALDWGVRGLPESYLVDPDGVVLAKITGGATDAGLEQLLARAKRGEGLK